MVYMLWKVLVVRHVTLLVMVGARTRAAVMYVIYQKLLRLRTLKDKSVGEVRRRLAN